LSNEDLINTPKKHFSTCGEALGNGLHPSHPHQLPLLALEHLFLFIPAAFMSRLKFGLRPDDGKATNW